MCEKCQTSLSRRGALSRAGGLAVAGAAGWSGLSLAPHGVGAVVKAQAQEPVSADQALDLLMEGNARYVSGDTEPHDFAADRAALAEGQAPFAVILGCADSRVAPELAFDQSRGQLFVLRVAGNTLNVKNLASIEFATSVLGSPLVMVLGHSACGAVDAAIEAVKRDAQLPGHLPELIEPIRPAVEAVRSEPGDMLTNAIEKNVALTVDQLATSEPIVSALVDEGRVKVVGAVYDLASGEVVLLS